MKEVPPPTLARWYCFKQMCQEHVFCIHTFIQSSQSPPRGQHQYHVLFINVGNEAFSTKCSQSLHQPVWFLRFGLPVSSAPQYSLEKQNWKNTACPLYPWAPHPQIQTTMEWKKTTKNKKAIGSVLHTSRHTFLSLFPKQYNSYLCSLNITLSIISNLELI